MSDTAIHKGLAGVVVDETRISKIFDDSNTLTYYGYAVQDLAKYCRFEEVAYLLWHGDLPSRDQLAEFEVREATNREIDSGLIDVLRKFRKDAHPMDTLRTAISFLGAQDETWADSSREGNLAKAIHLLAKIPTIIAADARIRNGQDPIAPRSDLKMADNFFHMYFGAVPEPEIVKAFDASLTFYAEHGFNASTFTARTVTSSLSDLYSAVTAAVGSLKGPLHGGANEAVMHMFLEIDDPAKAEKWMQEKIAKKELIMGFGHRVYKNGDSRVPYMREVFYDVARLRAGDKWVKMSKILEETMRREKNIHPNLDFPVGPCYYLMGIDIPTFTPVFVMSRITGWCAHIMEQLEANKLVRPLATYTGPGQRTVPPLEKRKAA